MGKVVERVSAKGFTDVKRPKTSVGKMLDKSEQRALANHNLFPEEGTIVTIHDLMVYEHCHTEWNEELWGKEYVHVYECAHPYTLAPDGTEKRYEIVCYTHGKRDIWNPSNKLLLKCVYPDNCVNSASTVSITTRAVASGVTKLRVVREKRDK